MLAETRIFQVQLKLPRDVERCLRLLAVQQGRSFNAVVLEALRRADANASNGER